jgi:hypothetical protein
MKKKLLSITILTASLFFSSCATILTGSKQSITFNSFPQGANIEVDGIDRGVTPAAVKLKKGFNGQTVTLKKEGYDPKIFQPETTFNAVSVINFFSILGWGIDAATGAMMKYDPKVYEIKLQPTQK